MTYYEGAHFALEQMNKALGRDSVTGATVMAAEAQALATLAVAEELRTANLIRLWEVQGAFDEDWPLGVEHDEAYAEILARLGRT